MITINNGSLSILVTKGAYNGVYKSLGWIEGDIKAKEKPLAIETFAAKEEQGNESVKAEEKDDDEKIDFSEKPLSELSGTELKMLAKSLGIDFSGVKKVKELRALVREKMP